MLLVVTALFGFSSVVNAQTWPAQDAAGEYCIEGIVIDWEEQPMAGIDVQLIPPSGPWLTDTTDDGDDEGEFKFESSTDIPLPVDKFAPVPGTYTVEAMLPDDPSTPYPDWENVTQNPISFNLDADLDDCVQIRFKLRQVVPVTVYKIDSDHNPLPNWTIDAVPGGGNLFAEPQSEDTDVNGAAMFTLTPGVWIFMERQPDSDEEGIQPDPFQPVVPRTGRMEIDVQPTDVNNPYILVFKNEFKDNGCISVRKYGFCEEVRDEQGNIVEGAACEGVSDPNHPDWGYGVAGWEFTLKRSDGTIARVGTTDAEGIVNFTGLPFGPYTIVEEDRAGWDDVSLNAVKVTVDSNACLQVPFQNEQADTGFCIEGYKYDANLHEGNRYGIPNWKIETDPVDDGGYEPDDVYTDGLGKYRIDFPANDYRIPGSEFEVCEDEDEMDGWLPRTPTCQIVKMPVKPGACVQALDFINEQVGHSQNEKIQAKQDAMEEHMKDSAGDMHEPMDKGMPKDMDGGAMWGDGSSGMYCADYVVVQPGDGLFDIGYDNGKTPQQMVDANPDVKAPNYVLYVGQKVCIP